MLADSKDAGKSFRPISKRDRYEQVQLIENLKNLTNEGYSQRAAAKELNASRTTLQAWLKSQETLDADPIVLNFFESTEGLAFLHQLCTALHVVFAEDGGCGMELISQFLTLSGLDRFVASSPESQRLLNLQVGQQMMIYAEKEQKELAAQMQEKEITVAVDETFFDGKPMLVAMEPTSGFVLLEELEDKRDSETWYKRISDALNGLKCRIIQVTGDEAKGLIALAHNYLGSHYSPDLFHVTQELWRGVTPFKSKIRSAQVKLEHLHDALEETKESAKQYLAGNRGRGAPPNWYMHIQKATENVVAQKNELKRLADVKDAMDNLIKDTSKCYHLVDLQSGQRRSGEIVMQELTGKISELKFLAISEGLSEKSIDHIDKAARVIPKMGATIDFALSYIKRNVDKLGLSTKEALAIHSKLIPSAYLNQVAGKVKTSEERQPLQALARSLIEPVFGIDGAFSQCILEKRQQLLNFADQMAMIFQRSSSCVEGRNGALSLRYHGLRGLTQRKQKSSVIMANYYAKRADGTTAAQRFFGKEPRDLFKEILKGVDVPRRPRSPPRKNLVVAALLPQ
jgi:hypothetical protein